MNQTQITLRYAKALFDLALERKVLDKVKADMDLIDTVCHENRELRGMLHNPVIYVDKKQKVLQKVFRSHIDSLTLGFVNILSRKRREYFLDGIAADFAALYKEFKGIKPAEVISAVPMNDSDRKAVLEILRKLTSMDIELNEKVKPDLIGGFVLNMDNYQVDQSLRTKIKDLKQDFEKNLYIKGF